jgi:hypothetical protein
MITYVVFKRSALNWEQLSSGRKIKVQTRCSHEQAVALCARWNANRTPAQRRRGTMFEFMNTDAWNSVKGRRDA